MQSHPYHNFSLTSGIQFGPATNYDSLFLKTAVLGATIHTDPNIVAIVIRKRTPYGFEEIEHAIFSLTRGQNALLSNLDLDLTVFSEEGHVKLKLIAGHGPVYITCINTKKTRSFE